MKNKISVIIIAIICISTAALPLLSYAQSESVSDIVVDGYTIEADEIELSYSLSNYVSNNRLKYSKSEILDGLITQKIVEAMIEDYNVSISPEELDSIENSYNDFYEKYEDVKSNGNQSEIAYMDQFANYFEEAAAAMGMTKDEFEQYNIQNAISLAKKQILIKDHFNGSESALNEAVEARVQAGTSNVTTTDGAAYNFKAS